MDIHFLYLGQRFVWDSEKAFVNTRKHGVSFELACQVFFDPLIRMEDASPGDEERKAAIGLTEDWALLFTLVIKNTEVWRVPQAGVPTDRSSSVGWRSSFSDLGNHEPLGAQAPPAWTASPPTAGGQLERKTASSPRGTLV